MTTKRVSSKSRPAGAAVEDAIDVTKIPEPPGPLAVDVRCDDDRLTVRADDGREVSVPVARFPLLASATPEQRRHFRLIGRGVGIHWPDVDEDISVARLFGSPTD